MKLAKVFAGGVFCLLLVTELSYANSKHAHEEDAHNNHAMHVDPETGASIKSEVSAMSPGENQWQMQLTYIKNNKPVNLNDLKQMHTEKIHILIIDEALEDYTHAHPRALNKPGLYQFTWKPKKSGRYYVWADLLPLATQKEEYVVTEVFVGQAEKVKVQVKHDIVMQNSVSNYRFALSFANGELTARQSNLGEIRITDLSGKPVKNLEPIMGAYAHIVGFYDDMKTIVHIHPMGNEPTTPADRGGPVLKFHIDAEKPGFIKLFAQVKINGEEIFVPFAVWVK